MVRNTLSILSALIVFVMIVALSFPVAAPPIEENDQAAKVHRSLDDNFNEVAKKVPEFGGMFLEGDELKVYLVEPEKKSVAEDAVASVFGRERVPRGGIKVLQGQYSFNELKKWHDSMGVLFDIPGVVFTDFDESSNRLKVGVESSDLAGAVEKELKKQGIPGGAFIIEQTEPIGFASTLRDQIRPLQGGLQIRFSNYLCTLGFNGIRLGENGFVTNSHCTIIEGGVQGTKYYQPLDNSDPYYIGTEIADPEYISSVFCPSGKVCRWSDSAYSNRTSEVQADMGLIARPDRVNSGSLTIAGNFRIVSEGPSIAGQRVNKVGRTTGWTRGRVTYTCVNTGVTGTNIVQLCQDWVNAGVGGGDSGSPVFSITNSPQPNDVQLRGILWGGNTAGTTFVYSPIANIQRIDELGPINNCASGFSC